MYTKAQILNRKLFDNSLIPIDLFYDLEVVEVLLSLSSYRFKDFPTKVRYNKEFLLHLINEGYVNLLNYCGNLREDRDVLMTCAKNDGYGLKHAPSWVFEDEMFAEIAIKSSPYSIILFSSNLSNYKSLVYKACPKNEYIYEDLKGDIRDDIALCRICLIHRGRLIEKNE